MVPSKINSEVVDEFCFVSAIPTRTFNDSSKILDFFGAPSERKWGLPLRRSEKKRRCYDSGRHGFRKLAYYYGYLYFFVSKYQEQCVIFFDFCGSRKTFRSERNEA